MSTKKCLQCLDKEVFLFVSTRTIMILLMFMFLKLEERGEVKATIAESPALLDVINMSNKDVKKALELIQNHRQESLEKWRDFYAND